MTTLTRHEQWCSKNKHKFHSKKEMIDAYASDFNKEIDELINLKPKR